MKEKTTRNGLQLVAAYLLLFPILLLGMWIFLLSREVLPGLMSTYFVGDSFARGYQAGFFDRIFTIAIGVGWMVLFVVAEELLRRSAQKERLFRIFSRFMGVEGLIALALDGIMLIFLPDSSAAGWSRWLVLSVELVCGALFTFLGWSRRSPFYEARRIPGLLTESPLPPTRPSS